MVTLGESDIRGRYSHESVVQPAPLPEPATSSPELIRVKPECIDVLSRLIEAFVPDLARFDRDQRVFVRSLDGSVRQ